MTGLPEDIHEIDLMAYADGLLDDDAARKAAVEAYLQATPGDAARVAAIIHDNRALRGLYSSELQRPTPQWMLRMVREPARSRRRLHGAAAAGVGFAVLVAAAGGWLIGQEDNGAPVPPGLLHDIAAHHFRPAAQTAMSLPTVGAFLPNLSRNVLIQVPVPDLSAYGLNFAGRSLIEVGGQRMERVVYLSPRGTANLFMRLRPNAKTTTIQHFQADNISVQYWSDGRLAYALTVDAKRGEVAPPAQEVRDAIEPGRLIEQSPKGGDEVESLARDDAARVRWRGEPSGLRPQVR